MPRVKRTILAVEGIHPNSLMKESTYKCLRNFITLEADTTDCFKAQSQRKVWDDKKSPAVVADILKNRIKPKKGTQFFYDDEIAVNEVKISDKIKPKDDYVYRLRDAENGGFGDDQYVTYKELLALLSKKIKNKYAKVVYDGITEKITYSDNEIGNIIARMATDTCSIYICQYGKTGPDDYWYEIAIFKNFIKDKENGKGKK